MRVKVVFLSACSLILFLLKHKVVEAFLNKKKKKKKKREIQIEEAPQIEIGSSYTGYNSKKLHIF